MSTSETVTFDAGACPCNAGRLVKRVTSQGNPWSGVDVAFSIDCPACTTEWRIDRTMMVLRSSESAYYSALAADRVARDAVHALVLPLIEHFLKELEAPNKKALHTELTRLNLTTMSYRQFLEHMRRGNNASAAVTSTRNPGWLSSIADAHGVRDQLDRLSQTLKSTGQACTHAAQQVVRRKIQ
ncbi:hypothetical protein [Pseudomonas sp. UM16]|uniref:hypothetical protein n=1 Tax=Pseudomonas sp. UM16 TaxID=3158962 RepID=UPI00398FF69E